MFTDVVGFSKLSAKDEEKTYRALNRDFSLINEQIAFHHGQVLNTMGDGMMVAFMSATDCMNCALAIQQKLYELSLSGPVDGVLQHRIGLHLGDVILNGRNTMGDTVNQAARIQSLARPDSIAMSRDFSEAVKGKVQMNSKYLGPRIAKNIPEPIPIHEVPPIDDAIKQKAADILFTPPPSETQSGATGRRGVLLVLVAVMLIVAASAPIFMMGSLTDNAAKKAAKDGRTFGKGSIKDDKKKLAELKEKFGKEETVSNTTTPTANSETAPATVAFALKPSDLEQLAGFVSAADFTGAVNYLKAIPGSDDPEGQAMVDKYSQLVNFRQWIESELNATTSESPLEASIQNTPSLVFSSKDGIVISVNNELSQPKPLFSWKPSTVASIAEAAIAKPPSRNMPSGAVSDWLATYKELTKI